MSAQPSPRRDAAPSGLAAEDAAQRAEQAELLAMLRESAAQYCARALAPERLRACHAAGDDFDRARWREMAELGWPSIVLPPEHGGLGLGAAGATAICRLLGAVAAPEPMIEVGVVTVAMLSGLDAATAPLAAITAGERLVVAPVPAGDGDPFAAIQAASDGPSVLLTGPLPHVPLADAAQAFVVPATLNGAPALFLVPAAGTGVELALHRLTDDSHEGTLALRDAPCEGGALATGEAARSTLAFATDLGCLASGAYLLGLAEALLETTTEYLRSRRQFGQPLASFQVIQHRLVDLYLQLRVTAAVVRDCVAAFDGGTAPERARAASRARYRACTTALAVVREAVQLHGAIGYTDECAVGLYLNRALVLVARHGNAGVHARRLARLDTPGCTPRDDDEPPGIDADAQPPGGDWNALGNDVFRATVRAWLRANYPPELRHPAARVRWADIKAWHGRLVARGWAAPAWPVAFGGMGLSPEKLLIFIEERERLGVARAPDQGILMVGPMLMAHGTEAQCAYYLPKALSGEHIWCQGYSEPNAGSDLASLRTTAERDGDHFVVNGQKIWTTLAQDATHMFCLVRTDRQAKPQAGISFLLIDLDVPGITIRPIRTIAGHEEFCEVFLDDVRVPVGNLVGEINQGWTIAKALLGFERIFIGSPKTCQYALQRLRALASALALESEPAFRDRLTRLALDVQDLESLYKEFADLVRHEEPLGADVSILKIWASETYQRISEVMLEVAGADGARRGPVDFGDTSIDVLSHYHNARPTTIYGGSNEIQRNVVAKQVLKLPSH